MIITKNIVYEDTVPSDVITKLKSAILFQMFNKKLKCEERSDYISTEIVAKSCHETENLCVHRVDTGICFVFEGDNSASNCAPSCHFD